MSNDAFAAIKKLLVAYAKHFTVWADEPECYDLEQDLPTSRTMFAFLSTSRGGARLVLYPLQVFPELREIVPAVLAPRLKAKCIFAFKTIGAAENAALGKLIAAAYKRVAAQIALAPTRGYYRKLDVDDTFAVVTQLLGTRARKGVMVERRKHDVSITLPARAKIPALLGGRQAKPGTLRFRTITPAERDALAKLVRA